MLTRPRPLDSLRPVLHGPFASPHSSEGAVPSSGPNAAVIDVLLEMATILKSKGGKEIFKGTALAKAANAIKEHGKELKTAKEATKLPGVGNSSGGIVSPLPPAHVCRLPACSVSLQCFSLVLQKWSEASSFMARQVGGSGEHWQVCGSGGVAEGIRSRGRKSSSRKGAGQNQSKGGSIQVPLTDLVIQWFSFGTGRPKSSFL